VELLQDQIIPNLQEGRKRRVAPYDGTEVLKTRVQAAEDVEDENPVVDRRPEVGQSICHVLELAAVLAHGEITLHKVTEGSGRSGCYRDPVAVAETTQSIHAMGNLCCRAPPHLPWPTRLRSPLPQAPDRIARFRVRSGEPSSLPSPAPATSRTSPLMLSAAAIPAPTSCNGASAMAELQHNKAVVTRASVPRRPFPPCPMAEFASLVAPRPFPSHRPSTPLVISPDGSGKDRPCTFYPLH
jgi:hypothetical protein